MDKIGSPPNGMTEENIRGLVHAFYGRVRDDADLAPFFEARLRDRWDAHLSRMCDFWSSVLLGTRRFHGDPMTTHMHLPGLESRHFDRWIDLFTEVAHERLPEHRARDIVGRAGRMRLALERAAVCRGRV